MHFCMELSKKLDIWYRNPPLPVDLSLVGGANFADVLTRSAEESQRQAPMSPTSERTLDLKDLQTRFRPQF